MLNKRGFILIESLIVMSVLLVGMMLLYSNYNKIILNYGKVSYYDNVEDLYTAYYAYINRGKIGFNNNDFQIINISDIGENKSVLSNLNIEKIYYFKKSFINNIYNEDNNDESYGNIDYFDGTTINYLLSIKNKTDIDKCEVDKEPCLTIVKFNRDGNYYFAKYEAYNVKPTAFKPSTTTTTTTSTTSTTTTTSTTRTTTTTTTSTTSTTTTTSTTRTTTTTTRPVVYSFSNDSWTTIANNVRKGLGYKYNVGDTKVINIGGTNYTVRVANNSTPSECNDSNFSQTACGFVVEFVDIVEKRVLNSSETNAGGWPSSELYKYANGDFLRKLPTDLQNIIINTRTISGHSFSLNSAENFISTDKIYLLSAKEVFVNGPSHSFVGIDCAYSNSRQLDYYSSKNVNAEGSTYVKKMYFGSATNWMLRTAYCASGKLFVMATSSGYWADYYPNSSCGFSPAFRIG